MGNGSSSRLTAVISTPDEKRKGTYLLTKEYHHNETRYYIFESKKRFTDKRNNFVKIRIFYGNKLLEKFLVTFSDNEISIVDGKTIYKYSSTNDKGTSKVIVNIHKNRIESVAYQKSDRLQFKINGEII